MQFRNFIILLAASLVILSACSKKKSTLLEETELFNKSILKDVNQNIEFVYVESDSTTDKQDSTGGFTEISIIYPVIKKIENKALIDTLNKYILSGVFDDTVFEDIKSLKKDFIDEYLRFKSEFPESWMSWYFNRDVTINLTKNILSLEIFESSYLGGAHGAQKFFLRTYDVNTGKRLHLNDLFNDTDMLNAIAEKEFRKIKNIPDSASFSEKGFWFENDKFRLNENFCLTDSTVKFIFNEYEIAPYSMGETILELKLKDL